MSHVNLINKQQFVCERLLHLTNFTKTDRSSIRSRKTYCWRKSRFRFGTYPIFVASLFSDRTSSRAHHFGKVDIVSFGATKSVNTFGGRCVCSPILLNCPCAQNLVNTQSSDHHSRIHRPRLRVVATLGIIWTHWLCYFWRNNTSCIQLWCEKDRYWSVCIACDQDRTAIDAQLKYTNSQFDVLTLTLSPC